MRELGIKAQYIKPYTITTRNWDFSIELKNILDENVYLTSVMDLYSRKIISWILSTTFESK